MTDPTPSTLSSPYAQLGIAPEASAAEIKTAYHTRLRQYPAHSHPQDFKAIRAAYETLRQKSKTPQSQQDAMLALLPLEAPLDPQLLDHLQQQATAQVQLTLADLIRLSF